MTFSTAAGRGNDFAKERFRRELQALYDHSVYDYTGILRILQSYSKRTSKLARKTAFSSPPES
jgi:hypothetical protein